MCTTIFFFVWRCDPTRVMASSFLRFLDHTQRRTTVGRTSLDEWSARRRDLYLTTHNTHNRQTSMLLVGFEPTVSAGERPQIYALDRAAIGTGFPLVLLNVKLTVVALQKICDKKKIYVTNITLLQYIFYSVKIYHKQLYMPQTWGFRKFKCTHVSSDLTLLIRKVSVSCKDCFGIRNQYTAWFKKMDSILYVYISWTIHGMWMIYITFERGGPKFSNTTARALA